MSGGGGYFIVLPWKCTGRPAASLVVCNDSLLVICSADVELIPCGWATSIKHSNHLTLGHNAASSLTLPAAK